jgi:hypothetical protein
MHIYFDVSHFASLTKFINKDQHLQYQINTSISIMKYLFIVLFGILFFHQILLVKLIKI